MKYDAIVIDNYGGTLCHKINVDWVTAIAWCLKAADDLHIRPTKTVKRKLEESGKCTILSEIISEIRIDKHTQKEYNA